MATAPKLTPPRRQPTTIHRRHATLKVAANLAVRTINVDGISVTDSVDIDCGDAILWYSPSGAQFKISAISRKSGPGPAQPFQKRFPNTDPWNDQVYSERAVQNNGDSRYKYTIKFKQGPKIVDPDVVIQQ